MSEPGRPRLPAEMCCTRRPGRPPKDPEERLSEVMSVRLTPSELDALYQRAAREQRSARAILREMLTGYLRSPEGAPGADPA